MLELDLAGTRGRPLTVLCLGAHSDDIEIGCGGTILTLLERSPGSTVHWVVFTADERRALEARRSAQRFLGEGRMSNVVTREFRESFFPYVAAEIKEYFESLKRRCAPDVIFTHRVKDFHQDHRTIAKLTWNTFRDHAILEYEIPKYDGDLGRPNVFVPLDEAICRRKIDAITEMFVSQRERAWFDGDTFWSLLRLRGMECNAPTRYAEAFYCRKLVLGFAPAATGPGVESDRTTSLVKEFAS
jgi:LmbE family N-acetylglucosaminyl deacetylase